MSRKFLSLTLTLFLACITTLVSAQTVSVSGVVVDESGLPVIGAAVMVKGTSQGTVADENGQFSFDALSPSAELEASALGYATATVKVGGQS